eukprot:m.97856 g.97856  ORF g.97856 m.97856 type:complete len:107 (+) comp27016_c0_seq1:148-468(+)
MSVDKEPSLQQYQLNSSKILPAIDSPDTSRKQINAPQGVPQLPQIPPVVAPIADLGSQIEVKQYFREKGIAKLFQEMAELMVLEQDKSPYEVMAERLNQVKDVDRI